MTEDALLISASTNGKLWHRLFCLTEDEITVDCPLPDMVTSGTPLVWDHHSFLFLNLSTLVATSIRPCQNKMIFSSEETGHRCRRICMTALQSSSSYVDRRRLEAENDVRFFQETLKFAGQIPKTHV